MKPCPYCAEEIQDAAIVCKHCGRDLDPQAVAAQTEANDHEFIPAEELRPSPEQEQLWIKPSKTKKGKTNWTGLVIIALLFVCGILWLISNTSGSSSSTRSTVPTRAATSAPMTYRVQYKVSGTASAASLTWENSQGGTEQGDYQVPFSKAFTFDFGDFVYISAQQDSGGTEIICEIWVNGIKWKTST